MKPSEAGFDGERGLILQDPSSRYPSGVLYKLLRGKRPPPVERNLRNKLTWYYPDGKDPILYYVNDDGQTFELDFLPTGNPFPQ